MARRWGKNSAYFFNLEKKRSDSKKISSLYIDANVVTDEKRISKFVSDLYQKLYSSSFNPHSSDLFFSKIQPFIPCISINNKNLCEKEMS